MSLKTGKEVYEEFMKDDDRACDWELVPEDEKELWNNLAGDYDW